MLDVLLLNSVVTGMLLDLHISCFDLLFFKFFISNKKFHYRKHVKGCNPHTQDVYGSGP